MPSGFLFTVEPLPDSMMTRVHHIPPSQACVFESLKCVLQANPSGLPAIDESFKTINTASAAAAAGRELLLGIIKELRHSIRTETVPRPEIMQQMCSLVWNKVVQIALHRADIAQVVFGAGSGTLPGANAKRTPLGPLLPREGAALIGAKHTMSSSTLSAGMTNEVSTKCEEPTSSIELILQRTESSEGFLFEPDREQPSQEQQNHAAETTSVAETSAAGWSFQSTNDTVSTASEDDDELLDMLEWDVNCMLDYDLETV